MSLAFNDTSNYRGLVQQYEKEIGVDRGDISGNADKLKDLTVDINLALDDFTRIAIQASGLWQYDDSNQTDYPIITANLISGQRDYAFTADQSGNLILDVYKVFCADSTSVFHELKPVDVETAHRRHLTSFTNGLNASGVPRRYDKLSNAIFLDPIPNYDSAGGLKMYVNREASYFSSSDTSKRPGIPGIFHRYLVIVPAYRYAARNSMSIAGGRLRNGAYTGLLAEVVNMEADIKEYFAHRDKDVRPRLTMRGTKFI